MAEYEKRKGADHTSTPKTGINPETHQVNYNRISNMCLFISILGIAIVFISYVKDNDQSLFLGIGMMGASTLVQFALNPIEDEEDEE